MTHALRRAHALTKLGGTCQSFQARLRGPSPAPCYATGRGVVVDPVFLKSVQALAATWERESGRWKYSHCLGVNTWSVYPPGARVLRNAVHTEENVWIGEALPILPGLQPGYLRRA